MFSWLKPFKLNKSSYTPLYLNKFNKFYLKFLWFQAPGILGSFTHYETNDRPNFVLRNLHTLISHSKVRNVGAYKQSMPRLLLKESQKRRHLRLVLG